jgi:hypothetical protein
MLSQEEYVKKELDRLNLKPSIKEVVLETIDFPMTITQLNELIDKHKKDYTSDEIEISPEYDYNYGEPNIVIKVIVKESEVDFNNRVNSIRRKIEMDYDRMAKALEI